MNDEKDEIKNNGETEILDFNNPHFVFKPNEHHEWRQQGPYLVCKDCELVHAVFIGPNKMLMGIDSEGKPILKNRDSISR